jgi:hypothetical protein
MWRTHRGRRFRGPLAAAFMVLLWLHAAQRTTWAILDQVRRASAVRIPACVTWCAQHHYSVDKVVGVFVTLLVWTNAFLFTDLPLPSAYIDAPPERRKD